MTPPLSLTFGRGGIHAEQSEDTGTLLEMQGRGFSVLSLFVLKEDKAYLSYSTELSLQSCWPGPIFLLSAYLLIYFLECGLSGHESSYWRQKFYVYIALYKLHESQKCKNNFIRLSRIRFNF